MKFLSDKSSSHFSICSGWVVKRKLVKDRSLMQVLILCDSALRHVSKDTEKFWSPVSQILLPDRALLFYWPLSYQHTYC